MSDLIERLRKLEGCEINLCEEAADEIERLRAALQQIVDYQLVSASVMIAKEALPDEYEIKRLRTALESVLDCCREPHGLGDPGRLAAIHSITYKALEEDDE